MTNLLSSPSLEACSLISSSPTSTICSLFLQLSSLHLRSLSLISVNRHFYLFYSVTIHLRFGIKVEIQCVRVEQKLQWQCNCVMCAARHVFCTVTQLWLKLKLCSNMLPASLCMELGRNRSRCTTNGTTEYKTANTDQNIGVNVFL